MKTSKRLIAILCALLVCVSMFTVIASAADYTLPKLSKGSRGNLVYALQRMLNYANSAGLATDGIYGENTKTAVLNFQRNYSSLANTGFANPATWNKLIGKCKVQLGSRNDMVKLVQKILNHLGYNCGTADGIFGNNTEKAVKNFQTDKLGSREADGIVGPKTWRALLYCFYKWNGTV